MKRATEALNLGVVVLVYFYFARDFAHADTFYVSETMNNTIEKFTSTGQRSVFVNSGLSTPEGVALDSHGNLYEADYGSSTILKFDSSGHKSVFASGGFLSSPTGLAFDNSGNLYVSNTGGFTNYSIAKFDSTGHGSLFASGGLLNQPIGLAFDNNGSLCVANQGHGQILKYDSNGNGSIFASLFRFPLGLALDNGGNLYASCNNNTIVKLDLNGNMSDFVGYGSGLNDPEGLAFDSSGNLYVANTGTLFNNEILEYDSHGAQSVFASGLSYPAFIAILVPEPSTWAMLAMGCVALVSACRLRRHSS